MNEVNDILKILCRLFNLAIGFALVLTFVVFIDMDVIHWPQENFIESNEISMVQEILPGEIGSIDEESGLIIDHGLTVVKANCGACHSTKLVSQNSFNRAGWLEVIRWMQDKQKLWDLGDQEVVILDYLEKNCAPKKMGRRKNLEVTEWYVLNE